MEGPNFKEELSVPLQNIMMRKYLSELEILTFDETLIYLGVSSSFLYKKTSARQIPHFKPEGRIYFKRQQLDEWIFMNRVKTIYDIEKDANHYVALNKKGGII
jgi:excisionase family DNA binding protein